MKKLFSIVTNTLGHSNKLIEVLEIYLSSNHDIEIILTLDNPSLSFSQILPSSILNEKRMVLIENSSTLGPAICANNAIQASSGQYIVRNDDDDIPKHDRLGCILDFFNNNQSCDIVYSYAEGILEGSSKKWLIEGPTHDSDIKKLLLKKNFIVHSTVAFRFSSFKRIGFYNNSFFFAQDYDLYLRASRSGLRFGCIPKNLLTRVYHNQSITVKKRKRQILHSMAGRLLHHAQTENDQNIIVIMIRYLSLLILPNWVRTVRRALGHGR